MTTTDTPSRTAGESLALDWYLDAPCNCNLPAEAKIGDPRDHARGCPRGDYTVTIGRRLLLELLELTGPGVARPSSPQAAHAQAALRAALLDAHPAGAGPVATSPTTPAAHADDPEGTEHAAAKRSHAGRVPRAGGRAHRALSVYASAAAQFRLGLTDADVATLLEVPRNEAAKRCSDLRRLGYIARHPHPVPNPGEERTQIVCTITPAGRDLLRTLDALEATRRAEHAAQR